MKTYIVRAPQTDRLKVEVPTSLSDLSGGGAGAVWQDLELLNDWIDPAGAAQFTKDALGRVQIRGIVQDGTDLALAQLPEGYRPGVDFQTVLLGADFGSPAVCVVAISAVDGYIYVYSLSTGAVPDGGYACIDPITFIAEG